MKRISGKILKHILIEGFENLIENREHLNKINVFPVPDGDTGDNLSKTIFPAIKFLKENDFSSVGELVEGVSKILVFSARGNSGVIFSRFFSEFSKEISGKEELTPKEFGEAMENAIKRTYDFLEEPKEGTILTVIKFTAQEFKKIAEEEGKDFPSVFDSVKYKAKDILEKTKNMLPHLKKSGVVDSGGLGFYLIIEGMANFFREKKEKLIKFTESYFKVKKKEINIEFRYCSEWTIKAEGKNRSSLKKVISDLGDSVVVSQSGEYIHVHIHTNKPDEVEKRLKNFGKILRRKIDDLELQKNEFFKKDFVVVCDTAIDIPEEIEEDIMFVPVHLSIGENDYRDKFDISNEEFYEVIRNSNEVLKTSQPSPGEFLEVYEKALKKAKKVIVFTLTSKHSGTYTSALYAKNSLPVEEREKIFVVDTLNISLASGLIVYLFIDKLKKGESIEKAIEYAEKIRDKVKIFIYLDTIDYVVRGGRISREKGFIVKFLGLKVVLRMISGKLERYGFIGGKKRVVKKFLKRALKEFDLTKNYYFAIAYTDKKEVVCELERELLKFRNIKKIFKSSIGPALGVHAGPGAFGLAYVEELQ